MGRFSNQVKPAKLACLLLPVLIQGGSRDQRGPLGTSCTSPRSPTCGLGTSGISVFLLGAKERGKGQGAPDSPSVPLPASSFPPRCPWQGQQNQEGTRAGSRGTRGLFCWSDLECDWRLARHSHAATGGGQASPGTGAKGFGGVLEGGQGLQRPNSAPHSRPS